MTQSKSDSGDGAGRRSGFKCGQRPAVSYLVRFWIEPREQENQSAPYRGYARDLHTGEERYFSDPRRFAEHVLRSLRATQDPADRREMGEVKAVG